MHGPVKPTLKRAAIVVIVLSMSVWLLPVARPAGAQGPNRVGIVLDNGDGVQSKCVEFSGDSIGAMEAVDRAFGVQSGSGAVCKIGGTGCSDGNCWCQCPIPDENCIFWSYWHLQGSDWKYSSAGAGQYTLRNGDVDGWKWGHLPPPQGDGSPPGSKPSIDDLCPRPTDTPQPTATSTPPPTDTPPPPTDTPTPVAKPEIRISLKPSELEEGACAKLSWTVTNADEVYLDGDRVDDEDSREECRGPGQYTFEVRAVGDDGKNYEKSAKLQVNAKPAAAPAAAQPVAAAAAVQPAAPQPAAPAPAAQAPVGTAETMEQVESGLPTPAPQDVPQTTASAPLAPIPTATSAVQTLALAVQPSAQPAVLGVPAADQSGPALASTPARQPARGAASPGLLASKTTWFVVLLSTAVGAVGVGGLFFLALVGVLALVYFRFSRGERGGEDDD